MSALITGSPDFYAVVRLLRQMPAEHRTMALHAALHWSAEKLDEAEARGDLPGRPNESIPARGDERLQ
jgi:hypothetical protein